MWDVPSDKDGRASISGGSVVSVGNVVRDGKG